MPAHKKQAVSHSAPKVILLNTLKLNSVSGGATMRSGWYSCKVPRPKCKKGRAARNTIIKIVSALPAFVTHLPTRRPRYATSISTPMIATETASTSHLFDAVASAPRPRAYAA